MFKKDLNIGYLLDFYGELLSERKGYVMDMYYNEDLSLAEIADEIGISRQGVRDLIKKSEEELTLFEEKLGLTKKFARVKTCADELEALLKASELPSDEKDKAISLAEEIKNNT